MAAARARRSLIAPKYSRESLIGLKAPSWRRGHTGRMTSRTVLTAAAAIAICLLGAGAGAGLYAAIGPEHTSTVVSRTIDQGQPVAASTGTSINEVYTRTYQGV